MRLFQAWGMESFGNRNGSKRWDFSRPEKCGMMIKGCKGSWRGMSGSF